MNKLLYIFLLFPAFLAAQVNHQMNREWSLPFTDKADTSAPRIPALESAIQPYIMPAVVTSADKSRSWLLRKLKKENFIIVNDAKDGFFMTIDPLLNLEYGKDLAETGNNTFYKNTRGLIVRGSVGKRFAFESSFYENQSTFVRYIDDYIASTDTLFPQHANYDYNVIPGQGRAKSFKKTGYDYAMASGYVSYSAGQHINLQLGHGKHFIGDGYRSLLLSDNGFNYPFTRITAKWKNLVYTNLYTSFMNLTDGGVRTPPGVERLFQKKTGSFQLLTMNFFHHLQLGLFQGMIWEASDSTNRQHLNFNTFDPVIGVNTAVYGLDNKNNILLGATFKLQATKGIQLYGQYMLDDADASRAGDAGKKNGFQLGLKYYNLFTIRNLHLQLEYNTVRPYAYATADPQQSYTHYNQALAHPLGANFREMTGFLNYRISDFFVELKGIYAVKGSDSLRYNFGGNIFSSTAVFPANQDFSNVTTGQGVRTVIINADLHFGYLLNSATNLNIFAGLSNRTETTTRGTTTTQYVYFGIRTSLANFYYDF